MSTVWCLPVVQGRGAGLGNELVPWARAYLMAQVLGAHCLSPAFGLNVRPYRRLFGTTRGDWLWQRVVRSVLPTVDFGEAQYLEHGGGDVVQAFGRFVQAGGLAARSPLLVTTGGLWGGLRHVERAREFVRGTLYRSRGAAANLAQIQARRDPERLTVAMHVRCGDFAAAQRPDDTHYRGRFNLSIPLDWFVGIGRQLQARLGERVQFQVFSDGTPQQLAPLLAALQPLSTQCDAPADVSDLLALSQADLLVCSISSYSLWAALLGDAPYLWFRPQLQPHAGGGATLWSVWGHEPAQQAMDSPTRLAMAGEATSDRPPSRAFALGHDEALPETLLADLAQRHAQRRRSADLVRYGVVAG